MSSRTGTRGYITQAQIASIGGGLSTEQEAAVDALARVSVTDWSASGIGGWLPMGPPAASELGRHGQEDACISVSGTNLLIKTCHLRTHSDNNQIKGNGISKWIDLSEDWTATVKVSSSSSGFDGMPATTWGNFRLAVILGGGDTTGCHFGPVVWFTNDSGSGGTYSGWQVIETHKLPGETTDFQLENAGLQFQVTRATNPPNFWLRLEWSGKGYKQYFSLNGTDFVRIAKGGITGITAANPAVVTVDENHGLETGDKVIIAKTNSTPVLDGTRTVTKVDATKFSVPVTTTGTGSAGEVAGLPASTTAAAVYDDGFRREWPQGGPA